MFLGLLQGFIGSKIQDFGSFSGFMCLSLRLRCLGFPIRPFRFFVLLSRGSWFWSPTG